MGVNMGSIGISRLTAALVLAAVSAREPGPPAPTMPRPLNGKDRTRPKSNRLTRFTKEKLAAWEREALTSRVLPQDLHPHVRRRELRRREHGS